MKRSTARVATFGLAVATGLGTAPGAWAKPGFAIVSLSPAAFVSNCQSMGGSTSSAPTGGIRCTLPSGQTVDCSFNTTEGTAACQWTKDLPPKSAKSLMGDVPPDSLAPTTAKPPKATGAPATVN
jgi:hypothetical protein